MLSANDFSIPSDDTSRRAVVRRARERAAEELARHSRLNGVVALLGTSVDNARLSAVDYGWLFMAWQATRVLRAVPTDLFPSGTPAAAG